MTIPSTICRHLEAARQLEWLETNGLGGFASSTIIGLNTRRYHGLLVAATTPPVGRLVLLSKFEEALTIDGARYEFSVNQYPGTIHPQGHEYLTEFRCDPFPTFAYEIAGVKLEKTVCLIHGENTSIIQYRLLSDPGERQIILETRPLIAFRDYHSLTHENAVLDPQVKVWMKAADSELATVAEMTVQPYADLPVLHFAMNADWWKSDGWWYRHFEYEAERERGLDFREDLFSPFDLKFEFGNHRSFEAPEFSLLLESTGISTQLPPRTQATIIASTEAHEIEKADELLARERQRRAAIRQSAPVKDELIESLTVAADQFIVRRGENQTIIAGYHWFADWGRDTMIALPGLTLVTGRYDIARNILTEFAKYLSQGMLPNRFPDAGEQPEYNTVDATLWFFQAIHKLIEYTGDYEFVRVKLYDALNEIIDWHVRGTRYGICVDEDGLLSAGEAGVQLTWMDAKVGDWVVTPRQGKPVEIQVLWHNALRVMQALAEHYGDTARAKRYQQMAAKAKKSFNAQFWNDEAGCLYDVVKDEYRDAAIRPNQILAVSLSSGLLTQAKARQIIAVVERELLTPYGLRTLATSDPAYHGYCTGGVIERDGSYHQGTVWPWLLGPFITAYARLYGQTKKGRERLNIMAQHLSEHLREAGLGQVAEILDGDGSHTPRGCIAQAWSVGEWLRAIVEDLYQK
jgi:predicted glycogen debranching enzyme